MKCGSVGGTWQRKCLFGLLSCRGLRRHRSLRHLVDLHLTRSLLQRKEITHDSRDIVHLTYLISCCFNTCYSGKSVSYAIVVLQLHGGRIWQEGLLLDHLMNLLHVNIRPSCRCSFTRHLYCTEIDAMGWRIGIRCSLVGRSVIARLLRCVVEFHKFQYFKL